MLIVANWKMNLGPGEGSLLLSRLDKKVIAKAGTTVVICPPTLDLYPLAKEINREKFALGVQDIHFRDDGPFTGETSPAMVRGLAGYAIVGHSERRAAGEDDKTIALKVAAAIRNNLTPILCIGETLHDREHNLSRKVVFDQLTAGVAQLTANDLSKLVVAYEPVWSINHHDGHPVVHATPDQIKFAYEVIRTTLEELYGEAGTAGLRLLYGGSADADNASAYLGVPYVDGLLVGSASLNYEDFSKIIKSAQALA